MSVLILGADGYLGWTLTSLLACTLDEPIIAVDDISKRRRVAEEGSQSGVPILPFETRLEKLRSVTGRRDVSGVVSGVADCIEDLVRQTRPRAIVHLAQIPSAPFSMRSFRTARETLENNEVNNLAVLFALRDHSPETHLVKMGSMGEYAPCGVSISEGYVPAILDGEETSRPIPFPREADDVYHVSKINDSNYLSMACRVWQLAATDVMQSIVYGVRTPLSREHPLLSTRFDCDPVFGSVLNRFVAQAVQGIPLTVHAGGTSTTGLIALQDSCAALAHWVMTPVARGEHRVINQATETRISIMDIALLVQRLGAERGLQVELSQDNLDPRHELKRPGKAGPIQNLRLRQSGIPTISLEDGVRDLLDAVLTGANALAAAARQPNVDWITGRGETDAAAPVTAEPLTPEAPGAPLEELPLAVM